MTYVLTLVADDNVRSQDLPLAASVCSDGVAVDVWAGELMRLVGVVSGRSPKPWSDGEFPAIDGFRLEFSLSSGDFWLGLLVPDSG